MLTSGTFMVVGTLTPMDATADISACSCALIKSAFSSSNHACSFDWKVSTIFLQASQRFSCVLFMFVMRESNLLA